MSAIQSPDCGPRAVRDRIGLAVPFVPKAIQIIILFYQYEIEPEELIGRVQWIKNTEGSADVELHSYFFQYEKIVKSFTELFYFGLEDGCMDSALDYIRLVAQTCYRIQVEPGARHNKSHTVVIRDSTGAIMVPFSSSASEERRDGKVYWEEFHFALDMVCQKKKAGGISDHELVDDTYRFLKQIGVPKGVRWYEDNILKGNYQHYVRIIPLQPEQTHHYQASDPSLPKHVRDAFFGQDDRGGIDACCQEGEGSCFCCWSFMINLYDCLIRFFRCLFRSDRDE